MNVGSICMNCMQGMLDENGRCSACGIAEHEIKTSNRHLAFRTIIKGKYLIGKVIGEGGFGITYLGYDLDLNARVAIKEYCPRDYAGRDVTDLVSVLPFDEETGEFYEAEMVKFIGEAQRLAKFRNQKGIVSVLDYFKENGTAYIVMDYIDGITLREYMKKLDAPLPLNDVLEMMYPVIRILEKVHEEGIIHRDISPDNIMFTEGKNEIYLIDFGTARSTNIADERSLSVYKKSSYTPMEQQSRRGKQGPWTDVYELCATMYYCITGKLIPESVERVLQDELVPPHELGIEIPPHIENTLIKGLAVKIEDRIQSMKELEDGLFGVSSKKQEYHYSAEVKEEKEADKIEKPKKKKKTGLVVVLVMLVIVCVAGGFGYKYAKEQYEYNKTHVFSETSRIPGATTVMDLYTLEGDLLSSTYYSADNQVVQTVTYTFAGNDLTRETIAGDGSLLSKEEYIYNAEEGTLQESIYDENGVLNKIQILEVNGSRPYEKGEAIGKVVASKTFDESGLVLVDEDLRTGIRITYDYSGSGKVISTYDIQGDYISKKETYDRNDCLIEEIVYSAKGVNALKTFNEQGICTEQIDYDASGTKKVRKQTFDDSSNPLEDIHYDESETECDKLVYVYLEDGTSAVINYDYTEDGVITNVEGNRDGYINLLKEQIIAMINEQRENAGKNALEFNSTMMEFTQKKANASKNRTRYAGIGNEEWHNICSQTGYNGCRYGACGEKDVLEMISSYKADVAADIKNGSYIGSNKYSGMGLGVEQYENGEWFVYFIYCYR